MIIIIKARSSRDFDSLNFFCNEARCSSIQYTYYYTNMCLQILMLQNGVLRGRRSMDRYRDWRLDIDDMTYEVWFTHSHCLPDLFRVFLFCWHLFVMDRNCWNLAIELDMWALDWRRKKWVVVLGNSSSQFWIISLPISSLKRRRPAVFVRFVSFTISIFLIALCSLSLSFPLL